MTVRLVKRNDFSAVYELSCRPVKAGRFVETIQISTSSQTRPEFSIPVDVHVGAPQALTPHHLFLAKQPLSGVVRDLQIRHRWDHDTRWPARDIAVSNSSWKVLQFSNENVTADSCTYNLTIQVPAKTGFAKTSLRFIGEADVAEEIEVACVVEPN
jgi:hypothetical protein